MLTLWGLPNQPPVPIFKIHISQPLTLFGPGYWILCTGQAAGLKRPALSKWLLLCQILIYWNETFRVGYYGSTKQIWTTGWSSSDISDFGMIKISQVCHPTTALYNMMLIMNLLLDCHDNFRIFSWQSTKVILTPCMILLLDIPQSGTFNVPKYVIQSLKYLQNLT